MAGNKQRGELRFEVNSAQYTMHFSANAMCELEGATGKSISEIAAVMSDPQKLSMTTLRTLFWAGLTDNHPDLTVKDAGQVMTDVGLEEAGSLIGQAWLLAQPTVPAAPDGGTTPAPAAQADGAGSARPRKPGGKR